MALPWLGEEEDELVGPLASEEVAEALHRDRIHVTSTRYACVLCESKCDTAALNVMHLHTHSLEAVVSS